MPRILIVEDDSLILTSLARALAGKGFHVEIASSVREANLSPRVDLVLCDLGLPDGDGLLLVRRLSSEQPDLPIIILTARDDESDVLSGLASGAVDYVVKPFRLNELIARITSQLRLHAPRSRDDELRVGDLTIDVGARRVVRHGSEIELRPKEFDLLVRLATSVGTVVRRQQLIRDVWDQHWSGSTKTLDVHINSLRRKLGDSPGSPSLITASRGVGYRLEAR
jgi:DNA-binding response OmpR family regulator